MSLKWRHSSPIFHYAVNFIGRRQSGKIKASFHDKKASEFIFLVWGHLWILLRYQNRKNPVGRMDT